MKNVVLKYGLYSGLVLAGLGAATVPLCLNGFMQNFEHAEVIGYTIQVLSFLLVFFAIRRHREESGGTITFGKGFAVGILVTLIAAVMYVATWEVVYFGFMPDFGDKYAAHMIERMKAKGESAEKIAATTKQMAQFKEIYKNPAINAGITLMEVLPVGLVVTLVSAAILRRKTPPPVPA